MKRNPDNKWLWIVGGLAAATVVYFATRPAKAATRKTVQPVEPSDWRDLVNINKAMPSASDFPMGWAAEADQVSEGYAPPDPPDSPLGGRNYYFISRLLKLNAPSDKCSPPCTWIAVHSGATDWNEFSQGTGWARTRDEALSMIEDAFQRLTTNA